MAGMSDYENYDGLGLAELVRKGAVSPGELLDEAIERLEARNPRINAVIMPLYDYAKAQIAAGLPDGPFKGVPYPMKDLTAPIEGVRMTRGSRFFADTPPSTFDSEHVKRLKKAGLVLFCRTNSCELGMSLTCEPQLYGPTRSPWDPRRISGGSSGGAAAAVGARITPMAHASDGFGSIRAPAACCGVVGLKPTRNRNTFAPVQGEGLAGCSTEHAVTLTVRDSAALLDATCGPGPGDPYFAPPPARPFLKECGAHPGKLRIGFTKKAPNGAPIAPVSLKALEEAAKLCADLGHIVEEADPEIDGETIVPTFLTIMAANMAVTLSSHPTKGRPAQKGEVENTVFAMAERGRQLSSADYLKATQQAHKLGRQMAAFHAKYDVLLTPGLSDLPPEVGWVDMMLEDVDEYWRRVFHMSPFTVPFNLTGQPALMLPLSQSPEGYPVSVQFVARYADEATLFRLGAQLEAAKPWFGRKPEIARVL